MIEQLLAYMRLRYPNISYNEHNDIVSINIPMKENYTNILQILNILSQDNNLSVIPENLTQLIKLLTIAEQKCKIANIFFKCELSEPSVKNIICSYDDECITGKFYIGLYVFCFSPHEFYGVDFNPFNFNYEEIMNKIDNIISDVN